MHNFRHIDMSSIFYQIWYLCGQRFHRNAKHTHRQIDKQTSIFIIIDATKSTVARLNTFVFQKCHLYRSKGNIMFYFESDFQIMKFLNRCKDLLSEFPIFRVFKLLIKSSLKAAWLMSYVVCWTYYLKKRMGLWERARCGTCSIAIVCDSILTPWFKKRHTYIKNWKILKYIIAGIQKTNCQVGTRKKQIGIKSKSIDVDEELKNDYQTDKKIYLGHA